MWYYIITQYLITYIRIYILQYNIIICYGFKDVGVVRSARRFGANSSRRLQTRV